MARRKSSPGEGVSLFPFMSILACLIGILTLMIYASMQVQEMDRKGQTQEERDRAIENRDLKRRISELSSTVEALEKRIGNERRTVAELAKLEDREIALKLKLEELARALDRANSDPEFQKKVENLKRELAVLKSGQPALEKRIAELLAEIEKRKAPPKEESPVLVRPGGSGSRQAKNIFFVECNSTGIVLHRQGDEPRMILTAAIGTNSAYNEFLDEVKKTRSALVLFLIRKSGNEAYRWAAGWAQSKYDVSIGKLPIPNEGRIDLSLFRN